MKDFCTGCGGYLEGGETNCPACGKYTGKGIDRGTRSDRDRIKMGQNLILIGLCLLGIAIILML